MRTTNELAIHVSYRELGRLFNYELSPSNTKGHSISVRRAEYIPEEGRGEPYFKVDVSVRGLESKEDIVKRLEEILPPQNSNDALGSEIDWAALSIRTRTALERINAKTYRDVVQYTALEFSTFRNCRTTTLSQIVKHLQERGLVLREYDSSKDVNSNIKLMRKFRKRNLP